MKAHKHKDLIIAWANGAEIECLLNTGLWIKAPNPNWGEDCNYRIKPEPKPDMEKTITIGADIGGTFLISGGHYDPNLKLIFDGETGQLKAAEVLK